MDEQPTYSINNLGRQLYYMEDANAQLPGLRPDRPCQWHEAPAQLRKDRTRGLRRILEVLQCRGMKFRFIDEYELPSIGDARWEDPEKRERGGRNVMSGGMEGLPAECNTRVATTDECESSQIQLFRQIAREEFHRLNSKSTAPSAFAAAC